MGSSDRNGAIQLRGVTRRFGDVVAVRDLDLDVAEREFLVLLGPSGCGKSTALRMIAGLDLPDEGTIEIDGEDVTDVVARDRDVAMVFQSYALYPHMTVRRNIEFPLRNRKVPKAERDEAVAEASRILALDQLLDRRPAQLSGGQRQRVALARAIVRRPTVFLMDEPLSNLDAKLRVQTRAELIDLQRRLETTVVYVTHDQVEAMTMGDRVAVMKDGLLQQVASPLELYDAPKNLFVAGFIGSPAMNLIAGKVVDGGVQVGDHVVPVAREILAKAQGEADLTLGIRPEHFHTTEDGKGIAIDVAVVEELGADSYLYGTLAGLSADEKLNANQIVARLQSRHPLTKRDVVRLEPDHGRMHVFSNKTGDRIS